jgi:uncharacterized protein YbaR (Trm112 family)
MTNRAAPGQTAEATDMPTGDSVQIDEWLLDILACPKCHAPLRADLDASELVCTAADCGLAYPVRDDIPVLLIDEARDPAAGSRPE